jgi:hypothetical protein
MVAVMVCREVKSQLMYGKCNIINALMNAAPQTEEVADEE